MKADHCVQIEADSRRIGKWIDEPCEKNNLVVCQKMPTWSLARLQRTFLDSRKKLTDDLDTANKKISDQKHEIDETKKNLEEANKKIVIHKQEFDSLKQNIIPIGFNYPQLPNEKSPEEIWPWMKWTDISTTYAGVFFRANGGDAAAFGQVQDDNAPRLETFISGYDSQIVTHYTGYRRNVSIPRTGWSEAFFTGTHDSDNNIYINFKHTTGEVRPRNMAIRIWKRTS